MNSVRVGPCAMRRTSPKAADTDMGGSCHRDVAATALPRRFAGVSPPLGRERSVTPGSLCARVPTVGSAWSEKDLGGCQNRGRAHRHLERELPARAAAAAALLAGGGPAGRGRAAGDQDRPGGVPDRRGRGGRLRVGAPRAGALERRRAAVAGRDHRARDRHPGGSRLPGPGGRTGGALHRRDLRRGPGRGRVRAERSHPAGSPLRVQAGVAARPGRAPGPGGGVRNRRSPSSATSTSRPPTTTSGTSRPSPRAPT